MRWTSPACTWGCRCGSAWTPIAISISLEKQARTVDIEVRFAEVPAGLALLTGYSADVEVLLERKRDALRIPTESLLEGQRVLRYDAEAGVLREVTVHTGLGNWRWTEVLDGLEAGTQILASLDQETLGDGVAVIPQAATESAP